MINTRHYAIVAVLLLTLAGCRSHDARVGSDTPAANASTTADATPAAPLAVSSVSRRLTPPDCQRNPDGWPFTSSDNVAPLPKGLAVRYQVYSLGPYAIGQPQLVIPWAALEGVVKPRFMAGFNR